jgi:hypothetical protein
MTGWPYRHVLPDCPLAKRVCPAWGHRRKGVLGVFAETCQKETTTKRGLTAAGDLARARSAYAPTDGSGGRLSVSHCVAGCQSEDLAPALPDRTLPERLYLESKWASLVSYGVTARLLQDVLPLEGQVNANGICRHTHRVARRCERDLLAEQDTEPRTEEGPADNIPPPKPAITVGLDGGYIRSRDAPNRNEGWFEVIAGKSTVQQGGSSCFAFVHRPRSARSRSHWVCTEIPRPCVPSADHLRD